jgi:hypothetical protein
VQTIAFIADDHVPFHDKRCIEVQHKMLRAMKPDVIWHLGDLVDFAPLSRFRDANNYDHTIQTELDLANARLARLRKEHPKAVIKLTKANHEYRLDSYITANAHELSYLRALNFGTLLGLDDHDVELVTGRQYLAKGQVLVKHGSKWGVYATKQELLTEGRSVVHGHVHKSIQWVSRVPGRKPQLGYSVGCSCKLDPKYKERDVAPSNWNHGMALMSVEGNQWGMENIIIHKGKALSRGEVYEA